MTAWTTALGPRLGFARGRPEHDPWRFDAARQAAAGESDAMLWLAALPAPRSDWSRALPCVALVAEGEPASGEVVIEVAWPGDTAPGTLFDEARAALVFRPAARSGDRPSAAEVLDSITAALAAKAA
jgi:formylmethanofuran dehydrogenase subunit B